MGLLGVDIGSSGIKGVVFNERGKVIASASAAYKVNFTKEGFVELSAEAMWKAFVSVVNSVAGQIKSLEIDGLAVSSHGETLILADGKGEPIADAIMNSDNRAAKESRELTLKFGFEKIYKLSGAPPHAMFPLAKLRWLKKYQPHILKKAKRYLAVGDFILGKLGLFSVIDPSLASRTQLFDINARKWSESLCGELEPGALSVVRPAGTVAGFLSLKYAKLLGLEKGTAVVVGGHDQACAALGMGIIKGGVAGDSAGTYECLSISSAKPHLEAHARASYLNSYCHVVPGQYITLAFFGSGLMMRWFTENICEVKDPSKIKILLAELESEAEKGASGLNIVPHIVGALNPKWNPKATAMIAGIRPYTSRASIYRGILEGISKEVALNAGLLERLDKNFKEIVISGGGTNSKLGLILRASAVNKKLQILHTSEASCLGAAILAGVGAGKFKDTKEGVRLMSRYNNTVKPDKKLSEQLKIKVVVTAV